MFKIMLKKVSQNVLVIAKMFAIWIDVEESLE